MTSRDPFRLKKVCADCPFRSDKPFYLSVERVLEIGNALLHDHSFTCHKTIVYGEDEEGMETYGGDKQQFCAGALATIIKGNHRNLPVQVAEALGIFDPDDFDHESQPTYDSLHEWMDEMRKGNENDHE